MRRNLLLVLFCIATPSLVLAQNITEAFAITGNTKGASNWMNIRLLNLSSGNLNKTVFESGTDQPAIFHGLTNMPLSTISSNGKELPNRKVGDGQVAACAYDKKNNRLFFTPMYANQLRWVDLNSSQPKFFYLEGREFNPGADLKNPANQITRMAMDGKGNGYALTNDAMHLIRFTTGQMVEMQDLGMIKDHNSNGVNSVHNQCLCWGGDMVCDKFGDIYLVTANHAIFKINVNQREARYLGLIKGLPSGYTTNGAVADNEGRLVVGSANATKGYYLVNLTNFESSLASSSTEVFNASDLANGNLLFEKNKVIEKVSFRQELVTNQQIAVFPNPVSTGEINIQFEKIPPGYYEIQLFDWNGRLVLQKRSGINLSKQIEKLSWNIEPAKGVYLLKIIDGSNNLLKSEKVMVQ